MEEFSLDIYRSLSNLERDSLVREIAESIDMDLEFVGYTRTSLSLPRFLISGFEIELVAIPGDRYEFGLGEKKRERLETHGLEHPSLASLGRSGTEFVQPFLLSVTPLLRQHVSGLVDDLDSRLLDDEPVVFYHDEISGIASHFGASVPGVTRLEYAMRGDCVTNFVFGDEIPNDSVLDSWLTIFSSNVREENGFGLRNLFSGEWSVGSNPDNKARTLLHGGAGSLWPWQSDEEWVFALPEYHVESADGQAGLRLMLPIGE